MTALLLHVIKSTPRRLRAAQTVWILLIFAAMPVHAQTCPDTGGTGTERPIPTHNTIDYSKLPIQFSFDGGNSILNGQSLLFGAQATQGQRSITADALHYDFDTKKVKADGNVAYDDPLLHVTGNDANMDSSAGVEFDQASFALKTRAGRGSASRIQLTPQGNLDLSDVRYTTCPTDKPDWELKLSQLDIDQATRTGTGRNVRLEFKDIPIFYTPWISFPVGDERKSGFLFPSLGSSSLGGYSVRLPWYWNIAPNYDATLIPVIDTVHGAELDSEVRYLTTNSNGKVIADFLPNDPTQRKPPNDPTQTTWRGLFHLNHLTDFNANLRLQSNITTTTDTSWFEDFGQNRDETSQVYLTRALAFSAYAQNWWGSLSLQNLQVLDKTSNVESLAPYTLLPQITVSGREEQLPFGFDFNFFGEWTYFKRIADNTRISFEPGTQLATISTPADTVDTTVLNGARLYLAPTLSLPLTAPGMYVIPSTSWRYTAYQLQPSDAYTMLHPEISNDRNPVLSAPVSSFDMGMTFEKLSSGEQRLYTLQPRVLYVYAPYRKQSDLPIFDTGLPDFNLVELFRVDRFVGPDRLGDTDQISVGVTTRMLDARTGRQFLSGTLGQAFYLKPPCIVTITSSDSCNTNNTDSSPIVGQISLSAYKNWNASVGMQWDPQQSRSERSEITFQYLPAHNRVINLSYRFSRSTDNLDPNSTDSSQNSANGVNVDQWESSFAWPIGVSWGTYGRVVYSRLEKSVQDYLGGLEYRSCCWNLRLVFGRSITTRAGTYDTRVGLQFELKGLGSGVGNADASLQSAIPGYSPRDK